MRTDGMAVDVSSSRVRCNWEPIIAVAERAPGKYVKKFEAVLDAFAQGELHGPVPKYNAFWRHMSARASGGESSPGPTHVSDTMALPARGRTNSDIPIAADQHAHGLDEHFGTSPPRLPSEEEQDTRVEPRHLLQEAEGRLTSAAGRLTGVGLFNKDDVIELRALLKMGKRNRIQRNHPSRLLALARTYDRYAVRYTQRLQDAGCVESARSNTPAAQPHSIVGQATASNQPDAVQASDAPPNPTYGSVVGRVRLSPTERVARLRAKILTPVLTGALTSNECASAIRSLAVGRRPPEDISDLFGTFPTEEVSKYHNISARTIQRWAAAVREAERSASAAGEQPPPLYEILLHRQPASRRVWRKITAEILHAMVDIFKQQPNFTKANVAVAVRETFGIELSARHVQRLLAAALTEVERGTARGGVAADVLFRAKLFRDASRPNETWIGDHSFLRHEHLDPDHPEYRDAVTDFDWECDIAVERRSRFGVTARERRRMHLTIWVDAFSRRVVGIRVWDTPPTTRMTLASLFEAARRFGLPSRIYTDNGSDFRSREMQAVIADVGVAHAFSRPYSPEGRGIIERLFRTIKGKLMPHITGYCGGLHSRIWNVEDLLTPEEVEARIWQFIERYLNEVPHSATKRKPAEMYDAQVGLNALSGLGGSPASVGPLLQLLPVEQRVLQPFGVEWGGIPYWCGQMCLLPVGTRVCLHYEPLRWRHVYVSVPDAQGALRFLGRADAYDLENPPPDIAETLATEAAWREYAAADEAKQRVAREQRARLVAAEVGGAAMAGAVAVAVGAELSRLEAGPNYRLLPPGDAPIIPAIATASAEVSETDPVRVVADTQAYDVAPVGRATIRPRRPESSTIVNLLE